MPLEDLLTPELHARSLWQFAQGLDLSPLLASIKAVEGHPGRAATDPQNWVARPDRHLTECEAARIGRI